MSKHVTIDVDLIRTALKEWQNDVIDAIHDQEGSCEDGCRHYSPKDDNYRFQQLAMAAGIWEEF